jgi:hypothetical protein
MAARLSARSLTMGSPVTSAVMCASRSLRIAPPSAYSALSRVSPAGPSASSTSRTW